MMVKNVQNAKLLGTGGDLSEKATQHKVARIDLFAGPCVLEMDGLSCIKA